MMTPVKRMSLLKRCVVGVLLAAVGFSQSAVARSYDDIIESKELIVSFYRDFFPFSSIENGKPVGIDIDVATLIAKKLNVKLTIRWTTADENVEDDLRNTLWKGDFNTKRKSDLMMRVPYDRQYSQLRDDIGELVHDRVHMFAPYHTEQWQIAFNQQRLKEVPTIALFQYHDIGVEVDTVPAFYLTGAFNGTMTKHTKHFPSIAQAAQALFDQKVDAIMGMRSQVSSLMAGADEQYQLATNGFPMIGRQRWDIGMAVKSDYRQLSYAIGDIVSAAVLNGDIEKIFKQHHAIYQQPKYYQQ